MNSCTNACRICRAAGRIPKSVCGCLHDHAVARCRRQRSSRSRATRHQRNRRADHRDRLGAPVETIRDRRDLHQDRQADVAMHVRAVELDSFPGRLLMHAKLPPADRGHFETALFVRAYLVLGPSRGMHFRVRSTPVDVILEPDISLIWPAGQVPSSTLMR